MFLFIYFITLVGNLGIIVVIFWDSCLHNPMYFFLSNLSLVDFCYSSAVTPTVMAGFLIEDKVISYNACAAQMYIFVAFATVENYLLASMAYDRYVAVCKPLHYTTTMTTSVCARLTIGSYLCGFLNASIHTGDTFSLSFSLLVILISYIFIFITILKMHSASGYQKALSTCASHFIAVTIFYGTIIFMYLQPSSSHSMDTDKMASVFYTMVIPMLNPLVYSLRNKEVKSAFKKVIEKAKLSLGWSV
ncbi:Olfactory receptor OR11-239 [Macaca fascicularis]|uniref:Olfactory receptor OR11-239 n=1 Tax=Macaca fascicularis TaxID=9541 RepID=G7PQ17_MACFA|nr:Olfactory receptor OR11-239 [Macaca fascicularis]